VRVAFVAIFIVACCQSVVGQSPLVIRWKTETPISRSNNDTVYAKVAIDPQTNILRVIQPGYTPDVTVSKFSMSGQLLFEKKWSVPQPNLNLFFPQTFSVDHDGNSILLIVENNYSPHEGVLHYVSYDANGGLRWDKTERIPYDVNVPWFVGAAVDNQNNIFFAGSISNRLVAQKISPAGELVWRHAFEDPDLLYSWPHDIAVDAAGRCYVVGAEDSTTGRTGLFVAFDATGGVEFWKDPSPRYEFSYELYNLRITENGAFYVTDDSNIYRVSANGQTEWSGPSNSATLPGIIALMGDEKVGMLAPDAFSIWDKTGAALGGGVPPTFATQDVDGSGESFFMNRGGRISEVRPDGSLMSEINFDGAGDMDIAATKNLDVTFTGLRTATNGYFVFTGVLTHSTSTDFPQIIEQPKGAITVAGSDFTATVGASGPNLSYQWFFSPSPSSRSALDGQTASSLQLTNLQVSQSGKYSVEVSNGFGKVSSAYAELGVHLIPKITVNLTTIPSRPYLGDRVIWTYRASYTSPAGAQWYKDGNPIPGATNFGFAIPSCGPADLGKYSVLITNLVGQAKSDEVDFPKFLENVSLTVVTNDLAFTQPGLGKDAQNNVYVCGAVYSGGANLGAMAAKFDQTGQLIWTNKIPKLFGTQPDFISAVGKDGAMYIPGTTNSTAVVCKLDASGAIAWTVNVKTNLNVITRVQAGATHSYVAGLLTLLKRAFVLLALNPDGTQAWTISVPVGSTVSDATCWLEVTADERIYLASRALKTLYAIDASGNILWTNSLSTNIVADMKAGPENSLYVASQSGKAACSKYNAAGEKLWTTFLRRPSQLNIDTTDLQVDAFGNAYIVSSLASAAAKIDSNGNVRSQWSPVATYPYHRQLQTTESGIVYMLRSPFPTTAVAKYDGNGVRRWNRNLPGSFLDTAFIPVTDRELFVFTFGRLIKVQDLETPDMAQITAKIQRGIVATNPVLTVEVEGAAAQKLTWYLNGLPGGDGNAAFGFVVGVGESIVPRFSGVGSYYAVEISTENSAIATPDCYFDGVTIINDVTAADGNLHFDMRGLATFDFRLQRSRDLINWENYGTMTLDTNGLSEITVPISAQEQTEYFRAIR
jgi:hypothetical protein